MSWTEAIKASALAPGHTMVFKQGTHQIALVRTEDGSVYGVDNRCPHEGYPLAEGSVSGCVLTCNWHNYKFDLRDGSCVMGEEAVRSYPTRERDGHIEVDLSEPDPEQAKATLWRSLDVGMVDNRMGRVARDVVRLLVLGVEPSEIAAYGARWDALHAEWGSSHALPVAADILHWCDATPGPDAAIPLTQFLDIASRPHVRRPERTRPDPLDPGEDPDAARLRFLVAVEEEDAELAEGIIRGAIAKGWTWDTLRPWLLEAVSAHHLDFGHALIYLDKLDALISRIGWQHADPIVTSFVFGVVNGTREDLLPEWRRIRAHLDGLKGEWGALYMACTAEADSAWDGAEVLTDAILNGRRGDVLSALTESLRHRAPLVTLVDILSRAAAERMLRFDVAHDADTSLQDSWLSVTHIQTYAAALRSAVERHDHPCLLRLLFFGAVFCNKARGLDVKDYTPTEPWPSHDGLGPLMEAIIHKRRPEALSRVLAWTEARADLGPLRASLMQAAVSDVVTRPIVVAHVIKNTIVGFDEAKTMDSAMPLLALVALMSSPLSERRIHRISREAVAFVTQGKVPRSIM
jgi:nitrite reductase/ring-hydroxylating ferredoxin subunit